LAHRSKQFAKAVAEARSGACRELEPGRFRTRFVLDTDLSTYASLARLLERVRHWRATEVYEADELVSTLRVPETRSAVITLRLCTRG